MYKYIEQSSQMAAVRLTRVSRPRSSSVLGVPTLQSAMVKPRLRLTCKSAGFSSESGQVIQDAEMKQVVATTLINGAAVVPTQTSERVGLATLLKLKIIRKPSPWSLLIQSLVEKVIMDSRFFTLFGVVGTLLGSVLCFLEGVFLVVESYLQYFQALYHHADHAQIMHLLIEALDMFLIGTAMLTFGMGLHVMFIGSRATKGNGSPIPPSNFFGLFHLKDMPSWAGIKSIAQAKSKIGHALMLLLQVGVLEKFKSIPLVTGLDLACFAAAIFVSSAGLFILSQISDGMKA